MSQARLNESFYENIYQIFWTKIRLLLDSIVCLKRHWPRKIDLKLGCCPKFIKVRSLLSAPWPHFRHKTGSPNDRHQLPVLNIAPVRKFMTKLSRSGQWFHKKYGHLLVNRLLIQSIKARLKRVCDMSNTAIRFSDYFFGEHCLTTDPILHLSATKNDEQEETMLVQIYNISNMFSPLDKQAGGLRGAIVWHPLSCICHELSLSS